MIELVKYAFVRPAGGLRRTAGPLSIALATLAVACTPAAAQLPGSKSPVKLPVPDGAVGDLLPGQVLEDVVTEVVNEPLPGPVEQVVEETPVAPIRDEVRRLVKDTTGDGGSGGGGSGSGGGQTGTGASSGGSAGSGTGGGSGTPNGGSGNAARPDAGGRRERRGNRSTPTGAETRRGAAGAAGTAGAGALSGAERSGTGSRAKARSRAGDGGSGGSPNAPIRTIDTIVKAVPTPVWIALGGLFLLALALAARAFIEGRRARALARDREQLMHDVQVLERALLPPVPERVAALAISVAYRPCDGPAAGGDFYDAFELADGRAAVLVGDVSGHGPDALEATNSVRSQLHALLDAGLSPRAAIATLGERTPVQLAGRFTTVVAAVHDPTASTLTFATAGHPTPIIVGPAAEELLSAGAAPPIGVGLRTGVRETTVALPPGSLACLYTDGLVEAKAGGGMIGRARLEAMVSSLDGDERAEVLLEQVVEAADETPDDMAVCVLRPVSGPAAPSPRVEVLELDAEDVESGFAERFLELCDVPADELELTVERARATVASNGHALVEITISNGVGQAYVADAAAPPAPV